MASLFILFAISHVWNVDASNIDEINSSINVNRRLCYDDLECGVEFNDISGELRNFVHFEVEYLLEGAGFDGSVWVPDHSYPNNGYLLFVLLGPPEESGLYKMVEYNRDIFIDLVVLSNSSADVAWSMATPDYAYITSLAGQQIVVVDLQSNSIVKTYDSFEDQQFAGPDGIYADDYGNIYFTDTDYNVNPDANPQTTLSGGNLFRIDVINDEIYLESRVEYGYNGIALNNIYGNGKRLVVSNTVDLPDFIYDINDNTIDDVDKIYVAEYIQKDDGSLKDRGRYFSITEELDAFPRKTFLDGMTFDSYDNLFVSVIINQTMSKLIVLNYNDCGYMSHGEVEYIGEIVFQEGFAVNAVTLAGDGYFYASLVNFPVFSQGEFVRFKARDMMDYSYQMNSNSMMRGQSNRKRKGKRSRRYY